MLIHAMTFNMLSTNSILFGNFTSGFSPGPAKLSTSWSSYLVNASLMLLELIFRHKFVWASRTLEILFPGVVPLVHLQSLFASQRLITILALKPWHLVKLLVPLAICSIPTTFTAILALELCVCWVDHVLVTFDLFDSVKNHRTWRAYKHCIFMHTWFVSFEAI